ncbi:DUF4181 domain-containing protein [Virgibacillus flavescens]|uniref:DUF4181 domain-containing protein n=1 Tax=Virgibacillus flavescens TaxID=1611422 RepID=UPI003D33E63C
MFWLKLGLITIIVFVVISLVKLILRRIFKIERVKKEFFSYSYINDLHRKVDKSINIISTITLFIIFFVVFFYDEPIVLLPIGLLFFQGLEESVRAFFEWKHSEYPKQAILTVTEMLLVLTVITVVIQFELLGPY